MSILIWLTPTKAGKFEIACAELCGLGHYRMRAFLTVEKTEQEFNNWVKATAGGSGRQLGGMGNMQVQHATEHAHPQLGFLAEICVQHGS